MAIAYYTANCIPVLIPLNDTQKYDIAIDKEACPMGLAPMTSATVTLVMGDALAAALMQKRNFKPENYAVYKLYCATITQRRYQHYFKVGFDYPAIFAYADRMCIPLNAERINKLQVLERMEIEKGAKSK